MNDVNATTAPTGHLPATRAFGIAMLVMATIGLFFSSLIMYDKIQLMLDAGFVPACTFNDVISCTDVMNSEQANAFGFPNPFIGMIGFPVVMTIGVVLISGLRLPRWFWYCTAIGLGLGVAFVHYLAFAAIYQIAALCPYCMVVWAVMLPLFVMTVSHIMREKRRQAGQEVPHRILSQPLLILVVWYAAFVFLILEQFVF